MKQNVLYKTLVLVLALVLTACGVVPTSTPNAVTALPITTTPTIMAQPTQTMAATATPPAQPSPTPGPCRDGELVLAHEADAVGVLPRTPIGEAERVDIAEIGIPGQGFGGYDRFIVVIPRLGSVWMVNITKGARTVASRGFCGDNENVGKWALQAHVPSFQQASRNEKGDQPETSEIGVYILNYEERTLTELKPGRLSATEVLKWIDVSFHENGTSAVPLHIAP